MADYALDEETGWHVYKRNAKWHVQADLGIYLHVKSGTYYRKTPDSSDSKPVFRKIVDEESDTMMKRLREWEKMRKAVKSADFVKWEAAQGQPPVEWKKPEDLKVEEKEKEDAPLMGRVTKFDPEKGFGFITPLDASGKEDKAKATFVHRKHVVGSSSQNPINLKEGARVTYVVGDQEGRACCMEVYMLGSDGKPLPIHTDGKTMDDRRKSLYVSAESLKLRCHVESWPGLKKSLTDRHVDAEPMGELGVLYSVLDGHFQSNSANGAAVAEYASKMLPKHVMESFRKLKVQPASRDEKLRMALRDAFLATDKEVLEQAERKKTENIGSSGLVLCVHGNPKVPNTPLRLVVAHVGSCRAVLCRGGDAVALSEDHRPTRTDEKKRIERGGGLVLQVKGQWRMCVSANPHSLNKAQRREFQGLDVSRSLGDTYFKTPVQLSVAEPECVIMPVNEKDLFIVLATDGVWEKLSNQEVIDLACGHLDDPEEAAKKIVRTAHQKGSEDNLTAMVIQFGMNDKHAAAVLSKKKGRSDVDGAPAVPAKAADDFDMFG